MLSVIIPVVTIISWINLTLAESVFNITALGSSVDSLQSHQPSLIDPS